MRVLLENCCNSLGDYIGVPVVASALTAMTLGFFAFKPGQASGGEESQSLQLVQIDSLELLDARPPNPHPLCSFWLVKPAGLLRLIDEKTATVTVKEYKMKVSLMAEFISHTSLLEMHHKLRLQHHKRRLEDVIQDLEADLEEKKAEVKILEKKLRPDPEDQPAQELDVSESWFAHGNWNKVYITLSCSVFDFTMAYLALFARKANPNPAQSAKKKGIQFNIKEEQRVETVMPLSIHEKINCITSLITKPLIDDRTYLSVWQWSICQALKQTQQPLPWTEGALCWPHLKSQRNQMQGSYVCHSSDWRCWILQAAVCRASHPEAGCRSFMEKVIPWVENSFQILFVWLATR